MTIAPVLIPKDNPLLSSIECPDYGRVQPLHIPPALDYSLNRCYLALHDCAKEQSAYRWVDCVQPLIDADNVLNACWGTLGHLQSVQDIPAWRDIYNAYLPKISSYYLERQQHQGLYQKYILLLNQPDFNSWELAEQQFIHHYLRDFRLAGGALPTPDRARFKQIEEELSQQQAQFTQNLQDATDAFFLDIQDESELDGIPQDTRSTALALAKEHGYSGWRLSLQAPCWQAVMRYAKNRELREKMYRASFTRASDQGDTRWNNTAIINRILRLRSQAAKLLEYPHYTAMTLTHRMARSKEEVVDFLLRIAGEAKPIAQKEISELQDYAKQLGISKLEAWDLSFVAERLREERYAFSEEEVRAYFPEDQVRAGLLKLLHELFDIRLEEYPMPVWHDKVQSFRLQTPTNESFLYWDLYAREAKHGGAWMNGLLSRRRTLTPEGMNGQVHQPVAAMVCNFSSPLSNKEGELEKIYLSHDEILTLLHESGHALHHLLTEVNIPALAGINGVEWDAVELPSQLMENFAWEWKVLQSMSKHRDTGAPLPRELFDRMCKARHFHAGLQLLRQIEFALFDISLHGYSWQESGKIEGDLDLDFMQVLQQIREQVAVLLPPIYQRFPHQFDHLFSGGYAAGYYGYLWSEVLSADAYQAFQEDGVNRRAVGRRLSESILSVGGIRSATENFQLFRGRSPDFRALLSSYGLSTAGVTAH